MVSVDKKNAVKKKEKASPRQREGQDTSTFGECDASDKGKLSQSPEIIKEAKCDMAERRMFSKRIVHTSKFLQMPKSSQCLYFHLGLQADDDGVVDAYPVMNMIKANEDDLRVLVGKGYLVILNEYQVVFITDWQEHNRIRADRKQDSIYKDLLLKVIPDINLREKTERSDTKKKHGQSMDGPGTAQYRVVEVSEGKGSTGEYRCSSSGVPPSERTGEDTAATTATVIPEETITLRSPSQILQKIPETGPVKFTLGKERLTETEYQELISAHPKQYVDEVIARILRTPYMNCLNVKTIHAWAEETQQRMEASFSLPAAQTQRRPAAKNSFLNFPQREYDFDDLEKKLLRSNGLYAKEE